MNIHSTLTVTLAPCPKRSNITMPLNLFLPPAFRHSPLNEDTEQQRDLHMSALGLHFLGADIRRPSYFWRPHLYCWAAEPVWANTGQTTGRALLATEVRGKCNREKKSIWENKPQSPSSLGKGGKIFHFAASGASSPTSVTLPTGAAASLVLEGGPTTSQVSQDHCVWGLLEGQHRPRALCIAQALGVMAPLGQAKAVRNLQPGAPACAVALLVAQAAAGWLKSVISKVGDLTRQAWGTFEMAIKHVAEF